MNHSVFFSVEAAAIVVVRVQTHRDAIKWDAPLLAARPNKGTYQCGSCTRDQAGFSYLQYLSQQHRDSDKPLSAKKSATFSCSENIRSQKEKIV